jgi:hypothetical protein
MRCRDRERETLVTEVGNESSTKLANDCRHDRVSDAKFDNEKCHSGIHKARKNPDYAEPNKSAEFDADVFDALHIALAVPINLIDNDRLE